MNYIGLFWTKNLDPNFASYKIFRDTASDVDINDTLVATLTNQSQIYFKDENLAPSTYFYKVFTFNQAGLSSASRELSGRVFAPGEVMSRIPGVPEPGDTQFPPDVAIPTFVFSFRLRDCPRDPTSPFTCLGPFFTVGPRLDEFGHHRKFRGFEVSLSNLQFNNQPNFKFNVHNNDVITINMTAQDQDYSIFIPRFGVFRSILQGQTSRLTFQVNGAASPNVAPDIIVQTATDVNPTAGIFNVFP